MKKLQITDEEKISGMTELDLGILGEFSVQSAWLDKKTLRFKLKGVWTKRQEEKRAVIAGNLFEKDFAGVWGRTMTGTLEDVIAVGWDKWEIKEAQR